MLVSIFYVTFLVFEVPSNLVLKRLTPARYIAFLTVFWGIVCTLTGICQTYAQLLACRLLLGIVSYCTLSVGGTTKLTWPSSLMLACG